MNMRNKRISALLAALILTAVMIFSGCHGDDGETAAETATSVSASSEKTAASEETKEEITSESETEQNVTEVQKETASEIPPKSGQETSAEISGGEKPSYTSAPAETEPPVQQETQPSSEKPEEEITQPQAETCTISINCSTILSNMDMLKEEKRDIVPSNGVILSGYEAEVQQGDSVYDILTRVCQQNKIHMDASYTPAYGSAYIKGIGNLYERDCGNLSGWTYRVNGVFPGVGCSSYEVSEGDVIEFLYTCNMGADVGNVYTG